MIPAWFAVVVAVLGIALGIFGSHATLGNKVTRVLTLTEDLTRRVGNLEERPPSVVHYHRRVGDSPFSELGP